MQRKHMAALILILSPIAFAAILGLALTAIDSGGEFFNRWWNAAWAMYIAFCAPVHIAGALLKILKLDATYAFGFSAALYYGTIILGHIIGEMLISNAWAYVLALVIVSLVCYIFWIKHKDT